MLLLLNLLTGILRMVKKVRAWTSKSDLCQYCCQSTAVTDRIRVCARCLRLYWEYATFIQDRKEGGVCCHCLYREPLDVQHRYEAAGIRMPDTAAPVKPPNPPPPPLLRCQLSMVMKDFPAGLTMREVQRMVSTRDRDVQEALKWLVEQGHLEVAGDGTRRIYRPVPEAEPSSSPELNPETAAEETATTTTTTTTSTDASATTE